MSRRMRSVVIAVVLWSGPVIACSPTFNQPHMLDATHKAQDTQPPGPARIREAPVSRHMDSGCSECGSYATVVLDLDEATDDRTPANMMGYIVEVVSSDPPNVIYGVSSDPVRAPMIYDLNSSVNGFEVKLRVTPVDLAGNRGPASEVFTLHDPNAAGCAVARRVHVDLALPLGIALAFWISRRRRACAS